VHPVSVHPAVGIGAFEFEKAVNEFFVNPVARG